MGVLLCMIQKMAKYRDLILLALTKYSTCVVDNQREVFQEGQLIEGEHEHLKLGDYFHSFALYAQNEEEFHKKNPSFQNGNFLLDICPQYPTNILILFQHRNSLFS